MNAQDTLAYKANWLCFLLPAGFVYERDRERQREWMGEWERKRENGERPIGQRQPAAASAWAWAVTRLNWPEAQRFRVVNHARFALRATAEYPHSTQRERKRARQRATEREMLNWLSCWATSTCLEAYRADRRATLSTGSGNSDWFHHWKYGLATQVRTTYASVTCVL